MVKVNLLSSKDIVKTDERPFLTSELMMEIIENYRKLEKKPLPSELVDCYSRMAGDRLMDFVSFSKKYQTQFEALYVILSKRGYPEEKIFQSVELFVHNVYLKLMSRIRPAEGLLVKKAKLLVLVNGEIDQLAEQLADIIEINFRKSGLIAQMETFENISKIIK